MAIRHQPNCCDRDVRGRLEAYCCPRIIPERGRFVLGSPVRMQCKMRGSNASWNIGDLIFTRWHFNRRGHTTSTAKASLMTLRRVLGQTKEHHPTIWMEVVCINALPGILTATQRARAVTAKHLTTNSRLPLFRSKAASYQVWLLPSAIVN